MTASAADGADPAAAFCREMLPLVSRTFAACIGLLPRGLEYEVLVAYLLCRVADTIEDCPTMDPAGKTNLLNRWHACLDDDGPDAAPLQAAFCARDGNDERLLAHADQVLDAYRRLSAPRRTAIRPWVQEMCRGMAWFARRYPAARPGNIQALDSLSDLDRYCYYVAGTVGHLLTDLFACHIDRLDPQRQRRLRRLATSFGLGLQLTNIIKDVADDRRRGWSFVSLDLYRAHGLAPADLLDDHHRQRARRMMDQLIAKADRHLTHALAYCQALPGEEYRIRLFCLTPLFFAVRTLRLAARDPRLLDPGHKVKISRAEVKRTIAVTSLIAPFNPLVRHYYRHLAGCGPFPQRDQRDPVGSAGREPERT